MRLAEVLMRVGAALVGFLVAFAHCLTLLVVPRISCDIPGNDPFFATLTLGLVLAPLLAISHWGHPFRGSLRWLTLPFVALVPLSAIAVWPYVTAEASAEIQRCSASAALTDTGAGLGWHRLWAPFQLGLLALLGLQALRYWRSSPSRAD
jgi:hypothetical protein